MQLGTVCTVLIREVSLFQRQFCTHLYVAGDSMHCPHQRGVLISEVVLYASLCSWDSRHCPHQRGVLISEVVLYASLCSWEQYALSSLERCPYFTRQFCTHLYVAGDSRHCPHQRGVLISEVVLYASLCSWGQYALSSLERCPYFRGSFVHISMQLGTVGTCPHQRGVLISEVVLCASLCNWGQYALSSLERCPYFTGSFVRISISWGQYALYSLERCPYFRGSFVRISMQLGTVCTSSLERCPYFRGSLVRISMQLGTVCTDLIREVSLFQRQFCTHLYVAGDQQALSSLERCPYFRGSLVRISMQLGQYALSSLERCPYFRGSFERISQLARTVCTVLLEKCPYFRGRYASLWLGQQALSSLERCPYFRGRISMQLGQYALSSLERCPYFRGSFVRISMQLGTVCTVLIREVSLFQRQFCTHLYVAGDSMHCPHQRGVLISEVVLYASLCSWDSMHCPHQRGVLISEVVLYASLCSWGQQALSSLERCPYFRGSFVRISMQLGTVCTVLIREVSLFQRQFCTHLYVAGTVCTVLIREVSLFQRQFCTHLYVAGTVGTVLIREVSLFQRQFCTHLYVAGNSRHCPHQRGVLISEVVLYTSLCSWGQYALSSLEMCPYFTEHISIQLVCTPHQRGVLISEVAIVRISMQLGTVGTVLIREVSLFQRQFSTHLYVAGTVCTVLIREVSLFHRQFYTHLRLAGNSMHCPHQRGVLISEVVLYASLCSWGQYALSSLERCTYFRGSFVRISMQLGTVGTVLIREVSLFLRQFCTHLYVAGNSMHCPHQRGVLISEVVLNASLCSWGQYALSSLERCPYFRGSLVRISMQLGQYALSSLERCPYFTGRQLGTVCTHQRGVISMQLGTVGTVLIREVSLFQRQFCTHLYVAGNSMH